MSASLDGLHFGTVAAIDEMTGMVRVRLPEMGNLRTDWLQVLQPKTLRDKHWCLPDLGEHVAVLLDNNGDDGVVLGAVYSAADAPPVATGDKRHIRFADGTTIEYDRVTHQLVVDGPALIKLVAKSQVHVVATTITLEAPSISCKGNLAVTGNISATGSILDVGGNSNHHNH